jgi:hypothetical protein
MYRLLMWLARLAGIFGVAVILVAGIARVAGAFWLAGFQVGTLFQLGIGAAVIACLAYLTSLAECRKT